ncbi:hypothetical protein LK996_01735 [Lysobacter sp. A6]|uniref:YD repeat-containing protein n=1 Tax=Noviluteimonas lactosilytica TaxID=2888523 RepID=A0ABS8JDX3_9GAMM|nr:hypothetical protein [Lysobacter lactosilyticus]MCC8361804.1 hypothetical protein [Lysobacter lactosilyticus]
MNSRDAYGTSAVPLDHTYSYDENGNVTAILDGTDATRNRAMVYDNLDRLTQMTSLGMLGGTGKIFYTYDGLDNITAVSSPNCSQRYCYDANNRLEFLRAGATVACPTGAAMVAFGYDVQGNPAYKNNVNYVFDLGNRLRGTNGGVASSYVYDALGRRARDYVTSSKYSLYTQAGQLAHTSDANGSADLFEREPGRDREDAVGRQRPDGRVSAHRCAGHAGGGTRRGVGTDLPIGKGNETRSDIDYLAPPSSANYFDDLQQRLPGIDPATGIVPGVGNPNIGPVIRFEPKR